MHAPAMYEFLAVLTRVVQSAALRGTNETAIRILSAGATDKHVANASGAQFDKYVTFLRGCGSRR